MPTSVARTRGHFGKEPAVWLIGGGVTPAQYDQDWRIVSVSLDDGDTWGPLTDLRELMITQTGSYANSSFVTAAASDSKGTMMAALANANNSYIFTSYDWGVTWFVNQNIGAQFSTIHSWPSVVTDIATDGNGNWYMSIDYDTGTNKAAQGLAKSTNSGQTWSIVKYDNSGSHYEVACDRSGVVMFTIEDKVHVSLDYGLTWSLETTPVGGRIYGLCTDKKGKWLAAGYYLAMSINNGSSWTVNNSTSFQGISCDTNGSGTWVVVTSTGKIFVSTDDLVSFSEKTNPNSSSLDYKSVAYKNGVWIATGQEGVIARSLDGGLTWQALANPFSSDADLATITSIAV